MNPFLTSASDRNACPLNDGVAVLDQLLAALTACGDDAGLDAALDFRLLLAGEDATAETVLEGFFQLRDLVGESHYLLCYRLRRWLESQCVAWVKLDRTEPARRVALWLDVDCMSALRTRCVALVLEDTSFPSWSRVRFAPASEAAVLTT